jgi:uncharacterized YigZ family protein
MDRPADSARTEIIVRRSRFIADLTPVEDRSAAERTIDTRREEHPQASHVVYAFHTGGSHSEISGMSDDGEPRGTAGRPVLEILKGSNLTNTLITVVRYFGGTKLGTGGLVRAYGDAARAAIALVNRVPYRLLQEYRVVVSYELYQPVHTLLVEAGGEVEEERFTDQVEIRVFLPTDAAAKTNTQLQNVSRGTVRIHKRVDESGSPPPRPDR